jgi:nuclear transport factor 2 (NTF2) superfamily protein
MSTRPLLPPFTHENWEFDDHGLMRLRLANVNHLPIRESDRKYHWPLGAAQIITQG